jgi:hypothetical protein
MTLSICKFPRSKHAKKRMAQRCITEDALSLVLQYGRSFSAKGKCNILHLEKSKTTELIADGMNRNVVAHAKKIAAIVAKDGTIVTTYFCNKLNTKKLRHAA